MASQNQLELLISKKHLQPAKQSQMTNSISKSYSNHNSIPIPTLTKFINYTIFCNPCPRSQQKCRNHCQDLVFQKKTFEPSNQQRLQKSSNIPLIDRCGTPIENTLRLKTNSIWKVLVFPLTKIQCILAITTIRINRRQ